MRRILQQLIWARSAAANDKQYVDEGGSQINENSALFVEYLFNPSYYANFRLPWTGPTAPTQGFAGAQPYTTTNQIFTIGHTQTFSADADQ